MVTGNRFIEAGTPSIVSVYPPYSVGVHTHAAFGLVFVGTFTAPPTIVQGSVW